MSKSDLSFVRTEMLPEQAPPVTEQGVVKWLRENLFAGPINTVMTLISLVVIYKILVGITPWLANGVWTTSSLAECREVLQGQTGGCFSVLTERWNQLLFGFKYPVEEYWRPTLAFVLLMVAITPVLFQELPRLFDAMKEDGLIAIITSEGIKWYHGDYRVSKKVVGDVWSLSPSQMKRVIDYIYAHDPFVE